MMHTTRMIIQLIEYTGGGLFATLLLLVLFLCCLVSYIVGLRKTKWEIDSLKSQVGKNNADILKEKQAARQSFESEISACGRSARLLIDAITVSKTKEDVTRCREDLYEQIVSISIGKYFDYFEWEVADLTAKEASPDEFCDLLDESIETLNQFANWIAIANHPILIQCTEIGPLNLSPRLFRLYRNGVGRFPMTIRNESLRKVQAVVKHLTSLKVEKGI